MTIDRSTPALGSLYQQLILDHYKKPHNKGPLPDATHDAHLNNPVCGDEVHLRLHVENGRISDVSFEGTGCSISQASISMMTDLLKGSDLEQAQALERRFTEMMHGDDDAASDKRLGNARALSGVSKFPVRVKCALLGWNAFSEAMGEGDG